MSLAAEAITIYPQISRLEQSGAPSSSSSSSPSPSPSSSVSFPPSISPSPLGVSYSVSSSDVSDSRDRSAYSIGALPFVEEFGYLDPLTALLGSSGAYIGMLYTYRSVSKAMPMVQADTSEQDKHSIHLTSFAILRPEMQKCRELMDFCMRSVKATVATLAFIQRMEGERRVPSDALYQAVLQMLDVLLLLDALKDMKTCLLNDFSRYKRAFTPIKATLTDSELLSDEIHQLQMFLSYPASPHNLLYYHLKTDVQKLPQHDSTLINLLHFACEQLDKRRYIDSDECHMYFRVLSHLLYLIDVEDRVAATERKGQPVNVFRYQGKAKLDLDRVKRYVRLMPIIPLYMDMHIDVLYVLKRISHFEEDKMRGDWIVVPNAGYDSASSPNHASAASPTSAATGGAAGASAAMRRDKMWQRYHLVHHRLRIRQEYNDYCVSFTQQIAIIEQVTANNAALNPTLLHSFFYLILTGLRLLAAWRAKVQEQCAYKYAFPCPLAVYTQLGGKGGEGNEYEKAVRFNYSSEDLYALVDVVGMIKGLGELMCAHQLLIEIVVRRTVHDDMQLFLQAEVGESARKADKHKRGAVKDVMLWMRDIAGDWMDRNKKDGWKVKQEQHSSSSQSAAQSSLDLSINFLGDANAALVVNRDFPLRAVAASPMQIAFMRRMLHSIYSEKNQGMQGGMFSEKDLRKESIAVWNDFYDLSFFYPYLLTAISHVRRAMDMSFLWYREFYLELTRCIQFPISMSLPWILTEHIITTGQQSASATTNVLYCMELYNDAANTALIDLRQQYLYDEVQAECGVSFEQLVFHLSEAIWTHYSLHTHETSIKKGLLRKWYDSQQMGGTSKRDRYPVNENRYIHLMQQANLSLLGRSIDLTLAISRRINVKLREYIDVCIRKFEASDLCEVVEFAHLVSVSRLMHRQLVRDGLQLDAFDEMFSEMNDDTVVGQFRNRVLYHVLAELLGDVLPNFVYNSTTDRFVRAAKTFSNAIDRSRSPSQPASYFFTHKYNTLYAAYFLSFRQYFGAEHFAALVELLTWLNSLPLLFSELTTALHSKIFDEFYPYSLALLTGLPLFKLPTIQYTILGIYGFLDVKLRTSLGQYEPLRPSVFHVMREIGNSLYFLRRLEEQGKDRSLTAFMFAAHFQSIKARPKAERAAGSGDGITRPALLVKGNNNSHSYLSAIKEAAPFYQQSQQQSAPSGVYASLVSAADQCNRMYAYDERQESRSLLSRVLLHLLSSLASIRQVWVNQPAWQLGAVQDGTKNDMVRLLSCLLFIFSQPPDEQPPSDVGRDASLFGDGFLLAIALFVDALGLQDRLAVEDYTAYVARMETLYPIDRDKLAAPDDKKKAARQFTDTERQELQLIEFLKNAKVNKDKIKGQLAWIQQCAGGADGAGRGATGRGGGAKAKVRVEPPDSIQSINEPVRVVQG